MINGFGTALDAIKVFETKLAATANNIANADTPGYKRDRVELSSTSPGGVTASVTKDNAPGPQSLQSINGQDVLVEHSNVNLAEEMTDLLIAKHGVKANVKLVQTQDEMLGTILDIKR